MKLTPEFLKSRRRLLQRSIAARGGRLLSKEYKGVNEDLNVECMRGHRVVMTSRNLLRGLWCPDCLAIELDETKRHMLARCKDVAAERGGNLLSPAESRFAVHVGHLQRITGRFQEISATPAQLWLPTPRLVFSSPGTLAVDC